jgi:NCAIR mutase (PurE)-related protein
MNEKLPHRPFDAIREVLQDMSHKDLKNDSPSTIRIDVGRQERSGIPEVVFAQTKDPADVWTASQTLATKNGRALASRCSGEAAVFAIDAANNSSNRFTVDYDDVSRVLITIFQGSTVRGSGGLVGIISAGTSDAPFAAEAAAMAREMGCIVKMISDVGVAGLHRLVQPLERLMADGADALIVAAGMDGALPSVVAGLVDVPVIGLPTSTGYGFGGQGVGALTSMLQSCAPGLAVVNIDNGIGAGSMAALIANRVAAARQHNHLSDDPER